MFKELFEANGWSVKKRYFGSLQEYYTSVNYFDGSEDVNFDIFRKANGYFIRMQTPDFTEFADIKGTKVDKAFKELEKIYSKEYNRDKELNRKFPNLPKLNKTLLDKIPAGDILSVDDLDIY